MNRRMLLITLFSFFFVACTPKTTVILLDSGKRQNAIIVANEKGQIKLDKVRSYVKLKDKSELVSKVKMMSNGEINAMFSNVLASTPLKPITYLVYFKPNSTELTTLSKRTLEKALKSIQLRSPCTVDIIGHTDTIGSANMNRKISLRRAKSVESLIRKSRIKILSLVAKGYGEEDLLVTTNNNKAEVRNRNVEIFIK